jgi:integrase/recombinase XerD
MRRMIGLVSTELEAWPAPDAASWRAALVPGSILDDGGALAGRAARELKSFRSRFGVWLTFLRHHHSDRVIASGLDYLESADIRTFLQLLASRLAPYSVISFLTGLLLAARAMAPTRRFPMLERAIRHYKRTAKPSRDKQSRLQSPEVLRWLGFSLMALPQRGTARVRFANRYLDGLAIVMLISMPLRISNFGGLQLGQSIQRISDRYWISVEGKDTKSGRPIEFALPPDLTEPIERYLDQHRPYLLAQGDHSSDGLPAFWVSSWGTPLSSELLAKRISQRTEEAFGKSMSPHLFRDAVATAIATDDPEHVGMILPILGHASLQVSEKHYNQAKTLQSARKYLNVLESLRASKGV